MKYLYLLFFCCALSLFSFAQSKDSVAVAQAVESFRQALVDGNANQLDQLLSNTLSYGHSGGKIDNKKSLMEALSTGASDFVSIELADQTIQLVGKNAIVRHKLFAKTNDNGKPGETKLSILLVWQKQQKSWKLIARQAVKII